MKFDRKVGFDRKVINRTGLKMIPLWFRGLSKFFRQKLEKQEFVDVIFRCQDGSVGGHQVLLGLASNFLSDVLSTNNFVDFESVVMVPDLTVLQVSTFLGALYGGTVPAEDSADFESFQEILELFCVDIVTTVASTTTTTTTTTSTAQTRGPTIVELGSRVVDVEEVVAEVVDKDDYVVQGEVTSHFSQTSTVQACRRNTSWGLRLISVITL